MIACFDSLKVRRSASIQFDLCVVFSLYCIYIYICRAGYFYKIFDTVFDTISYPRPVPFLDGHEIRLCLRSLV